MVLDPGDATPVLDAVARGLDVAAILITHHHPDHIGGLPALRQQLDVPVYGPADARIGGVDVRVGEGDVIALEGFAPLQVWHVPAHTRSHIAYYDGHVLFCGDTLFSLGCGRLFEGSPEQLLAALDRIAALPDDTLICCTHEYTLANARFARVVEPNNAVREDYIAQVEVKRARGEPSLPSTVQREKTCNPFLRIDEADALTGLAAHLGHLPENRLERLAQLRAWKDRF